MIGRLKGEVAAVQGSIVLLDVAGVGYEVRCSRGVLERVEVGSPETVVVHTDVREDRIELFGFADILEKEVFHLLIDKVKGVGVRTAIDILSRVDKRELLRIIGAGDVGRLQAVKGIGKKVAERIVLELRDKVGEYVLDRTPSSLEVEVIRSGDLFHEALEALLVLGFPRSEAERAVKSARNAAEAGTIQNTGDAVKLALRHV